MEPGRRDPRLRIFSRRAVAGTVAALALIATVVVAVAVGRDDSVGVSVTANGTEGGDSPSEAPESTSTTTTAQAAPTTTAPPTSVSSTTTSSTTTPPMPRTATWTASEGPLRIDVEVTNVEPRAGELVRFTVRMRDEAGSIVRVGIDYGDGTPTGVPAAMEVDCAKGGASPSNEPVDKTVVFEHGYRVAARPAARVVVRSAACEREERIARVAGDLLVLSAPTLTNGPVRPAIAVQEQQGELGRQIRLQLGVTDLDGFVRRVEVDWGDGTPRTTREFDLAECADPVVRPAAWAP